MDPSRRVAWVFVAVASLLARGTSLAQCVVPAPPRNTLGTAIPCESSRPSALPGAILSFRAPVAVHIAAGVSVATGTAVLAAAERACDAIESRLHLPLPTATVDIYVTPDGPMVQAVPYAMDDTSLWDAARAYVRVRAVPDTQRLARAVSEGISQAVLLDLNADPPPSELRALASSVTTLATELPLDAASALAFARTPWHAPFASAGSAPDDPRIDADRGGGMYFDHLFRRWDDNHHRLLEDLVWGPVQYTPVDAPRLWDEPDVFDILRRLFQSQPGDLAGMALDTAIDLALAGTPASEDGLGDADNPAFASLPLRTLAWRDLPAWVESSQPIEALGVATVTLDLADAPLGAGASVWLHVSPYNHWMVSIVRIGRGDHFVSRVDSEVITDGAWSADAEALDGITRLVIVAVNLATEDYEPDLPAVADGVVTFHVVSQTH